MQFHEINICKGMIFRLYTFYNTHDADKNTDQIKEKFKVLLQVLE